MSRFAVYLLKKFLSRKSNDVIDHLGSFGMVILKVYSLLPNQIHAPSKCNLATYVGNLRM